MPNYKLVVSLALLIQSVAGRAAHVPTVDELMQVTMPAGPVISPNGKWVVYSVTLPDFEEDSFISQLHLVPADGGESRQLTRGKASARQARWSPDSQWIAFVRSVDGKSQIFALRPQGGESVTLSALTTGVQNFQWSPDGRKIGFIAQEPEDAASKKRKEFLGDFHVVRRDYRFSQFWTLDVAEAFAKATPGKQQTQGTDRHITNFSWTPDSSAIAFTAARTPDLVDRASSDVYQLDLKSGKIRAVVQQAGPDNVVLVSPDGKSLLISTYLGVEKYYASNVQLARVSIEGGPLEPLTGSFDENPRALEWNDHGIYFSASQKTASHLFLLDPDTGRIRRISGPDDAMFSSIDFSHDGEWMAYSMESTDALPEIYVAETDGSHPRKLTNASLAIEDYVLGTREVISWKSEDGTEIEGILIKPQNFDPSRRYPLLCVIHGGPTGIDRPSLLSRGTRYYPVDLWAAQGALILRVNYRGSAGYGEKFRKLNMRNLGVGDAWDVLSGVQHLVEKGWVDPARVGSMGWSQGGYISAFLTTSSDRFAAISVGAGISNWATYYYNTDITPFTINYLGDDPADDPEIYRKTSPMSYILQAKTPTLIQHGEFDRRVPIPNAYELRQGLEDRGVPVEMVVYRGFGHGISKPRAMRAAMTHNLEWFNHYLFNGPKPNMTKPDLPPDEVTGGSQPN